MKRLLLVFVCIFLVQSVFAKEYHTPLLAVKETSEGVFKGSTADLYLEIIDGKGRVFLDTYPLTKLDTQMSTRFAKEIACSQTNFACENYDFIYTINSDSIIVGGPSAGAAIALLTIAAIRDIDINPNTTMTGTINSGGLIGPVGGLKEKIEAAKSIGIKTVLIPRGEIFAEDGNNTVNDSDKNQSNKSKIDLIEYGKSLGIEVIEVSTIQESLLKVTGKNIIDTKTILEIDKTYLETMKQITESLCERTYKLRNDTYIIKVSDDEKDILENAVNLTERSKKAFKEEKYYSAASYCFGANTKFSYLIIKDSKITKSALLDNITKIKVNIRDMNKELEKKEIKTITDLETYMIVKERLDEAEESVNRIIDLKNETDQISNLAYSLERFNSAVSWSSFFDKGSKEYIINKEEIKKSCINKVYEAEERYGYLSLLTSSDFEVTEKSIDSAKGDLENERYELCLFKASKAKAESDVLLNTVGVEVSQLLDLTEKRLEIIRNNLIKEQQKGIFPVVGYSYYEYANDLKENDIFSSMLFTEYSLELSNLDIYFKEKNNNIMINTSMKQAVVIVLVFIAGFIVGISLKKINIKSKRKK